MRVLIGCECSGAVRRELRARGHDAWSCDLVPAEDGDPYHYEIDVFEAIMIGKWDLGIFFPPCTHLSASGARWWKEKRVEQIKAAIFAQKLLDAPIPKIALENPVGILSSVLRKPDQIIQPWQFGHGEVKTTCLWLKNLPLLQPTNIVAGREQKCWRMSKHPNRARDRARTYQGIAAAMADQWAGSLSVKDVS